MKRKKVIEELKKRLICCEEKKEKHRVGFIAGIKFAIEVLEIESEEKFNFTLMTQDLDGSCDKCCFKSKYPNCIAPYENKSECNNSAGYYWIRIKQG